MDKDVKTKFCLELNNRLSLLEEKEDRTDLEVEECLKNIKDVVMKTARKVIGHKRCSIMEKWISKCTWDTIDERRLLNSKEGTSHEYWETVKRCCECQRMTE